jgi:2-oxo-4-hydroxy-4-carboxy-5-ureidoimidazoline decarboxylase
VNLIELDALPEARAAELLSACCGSARWVKAMLARRPFGCRDALLSAADEIWESLGSDDWREAFAHHPRIGQRHSALPQHERGQAWSAGEQEAIDSAGDAVRQDLAAANREYEKRFGFIYVVCATGKTAEELLALARQRLATSPDQELAVAAAEQQKITRLRLEKLLRADGR